MKTLKTLGVLAALAAVLAFAPQDKKTTVTATPLLESLVPSDTMVFFSVPDMAGTVKRYKQTVAGQLIEYFFSSDFKNLITNLQGGRGRRQDMPDFKAEMEKNLKKETGLTLDELLDLFSGELGFAFVNIRTAGKSRGGTDAPVTVDLVLKVGWKDASRGEKLLASLMKKSRNIRKFEIAGQKAFAVDAPGDPVVPCWAITPSCFVLATQEKRLKEVVTGIANNKGIDNSLASSEEYGLAAKHIQKDQADMVSYMNMERIFRIPPVQMFFLTEAPNLMEDLGLGQLKTVSGSFRVKDHRFQDIIFARTTGKERRGVLKILSTPATETKDGLILTSSGDISSLSMMGYSQTAIIAAIAIPSLLRSTIASNEKMAIGTLRNLVMEEVQWKANDRDRNGVGDFWVADVSGMYRIERRPTGSGIPLGPDLGLMIDVARADGNPFTPAGGVSHTIEPVNLLAVVGTLFQNASPPVPKAGYYFEAMVHDESGNPYIPAEDVDENGLNTGNINKFGFVAYPAEYGVTGIHTFIVDTSGAVFKADLGVQMHPPLNFDHPGLPPPSPPWSHVD